MFLLLHSLSSPIDNYVYDAPSEINYPTVLRCPLQFYFFLIFSLYKLNVESFYWHVFKFTDSFLNCGQSTDVSIKETLHFPYNIFWLNISFWFFIRAVSLCLQHPSVFVCCLFYMRALHILFIVILISLLFPISASYMSLVLFPFSFWLFTLAFCFALWILLKDRHIILSNRFYCILVMSWTASNIFSSCRFRKLQIPLVFLFLCLP